MYDRRSYMKKHQRLIYLVIAAVLLVSLGGYSWMALRRPFSSITMTPVYAAQPVAAQALNLAWPKYGQTAFSIDGTINESQGSSQPQPTASVAKIMTALSVLDKKPLSADQDGPIMTLTQNDVNIYHNYAANDGSVVAVTAGEELTERQALTALLLPSANNLADSLAIWAFGSLTNYIQYANQKAAQMGLSHSYFADASGFSPATTSTSTDLVKLGQAAIANPALASIVDLRLATVPVAGTIYNTNTLLDHNGMFGIKTGNTDQAGGCYLFAAHVALANSTQTVTIVGAIMGAPGLNTAMNDSQPLLTSIGQNFNQTTIIKAGDTVARYTAPWGQTVDATAQADVIVQRWNGQVLQPKLDLQNLNSQRDASGKVGKISVANSYGTSQTDVVLNGHFARPSIWWRLLHPTHK